MLDNGRVGKTHANEEEQGAAVTFTNETFLLAFRDSWRHVDASFERHDKRDLL